MNYQIYKRHRHRYFYRRFRDIIVVVTTTNDRTLFQAYKTKTRARVLRSTTTPGF